MCSCFGLLFYRLVRCLQLPSNKAVNEQNRRFARFYDARISSFDKYKLTVSPI